MFSDFWHDHVGVHIYVCISHYKQENKAVAGCICGMHYLNWLSSIILFRLFCVYCLMIVDLSSPPPFFFLLLFSLTFILVLYSRLFMSNINMIVDMCFFNNKNKTWSFPVKYFCVGSVWECVMVLTSLSYYCLFISFEGGWWNCTFDGWHRNEDLCFSSLQC